mgnify:CR=1 FL=1
MMSAPAFKAFRTDLLYPVPADGARCSHQRTGGTEDYWPDVYCVRKAHGVDAQPNFFYKPQFSSPQYSEAYADG